MDNLITYADFTGTIDIDSTRSGIQTILTSYITKYQKKILMDLLGSSLYNDMETNIAESKYTNLINGDNNTYVYNGITYTYTGLKRMLACFIYHYYIRNEVSSNTPTGETKSGSQNGTPVVNLPKLIDAWNEGIDLYNEAIQYIIYQNSQTEDYYPDYIQTLKDYENAFGI